MTILLAESVIQMAIQGQTDTSKNCPRAASTLQQCALGIQELHQKQSNFSLQMSQTSDQRLKHASICCDFLCIGESRSIGPPALDIFD